MGLAAAMALAGLVCYAGAAGAASAAGAAPRPSVSQVKAQVNALTARLDAVGQQYDQAQQQLRAAHERFVQVRREAGQAQQRFLAARTTVAQLAVAAFEGAGQDPVGELLTSGDPQTILNQASLLTQQADVRSQQVVSLLAAARQLSAVQESLRRTEDGIAALRTRLAAQRGTMRKLLASEQAILDSLTASQQAVVTTSGIGAGGTTQATYPGPTGTQADAAVAFVYAQLGKPYQWGATGPGSYDCSGLVQAAWAAAGVAIPRDTYEQWAALPHIPLSMVQPGDLLYYDGIGHVSMYVGGGYIIDAPQTGLNVERIPMNTAWYAQTFVGAARP